LSSAEACAKTFEELDRTISLSYLRGVHLNDALKPMGSRVDRHASLGDGTIGWECFKFIASSPMFDNVPIILETPDESRWAEEIAKLKSFSNL
jgi:deoxyribonuclease-4